MSHARWDWAAVELLKEWRRRPDEATRVGVALRHVPTGAWLTFGELFEGQVIALDGFGSPIVVPTEECIVAWDPETDPALFEAELQRRKGERRVRV